jgi:hypothetical protein
MRSGERAVVIVAPRWDVRAHRPGLAPFIVGFSLWVCYGMGNRHCIVHRRLYILTGS